MTTPTTFSISEAAINAIWSYVRENRHSLDSERATTMIRESVYSAVHDVNELLIAENELLVAETAKVAKLRMKLQVAVGQPPQRKEN